MTIEGVALGLLVGVAIGVSLAHWLDRLDQLDAQPEPEQRSTLRRSPSGIWLIHGHPTMEISVNPAVDEWPAHIRN